MLSLVKKAGGKEKFLQHIKPSLNELVAIY